MNHRAFRCAVLAFLAFLHPNTYLHASDAATRTNKAILALDSVRANALIQRDFTTLNSVLGNDLTYIHASGLIENKAEFLAQLMSNKRRYISIQTSDASVRALSQVAIITARSEIRVVHEGQENDLSLRITEVYEKRAGKWQLIAYQSTRLAP